MPLLLTAFEGFSRTLPAGPMKLTRLQLWKSAAVVGSYSAFGSGVRRRALSEMIWRVAMVKANLAVRDKHWVKSNDFIALDPSEKGSVSYFLGLAQAHATCTRILGYSHLVHLDKLMKHHGHALAGGRSDLVGLTAASIIGKKAVSNIATVEAKGRTDGAPPHLRASTKAQAMTISALKATNVFETVASIAHFDTKGRWRASLGDPAWTGRNSDVTVEAALRHYYARVINAGRQSRTWEVRDGQARFDVPRVGLSLSMPNELVEAYDSSRGSATETGRGALMKAYTRLSRQTGSLDDLITPSRTERANRVHAPGDAPLGKGLRGELFSTVVGHYRFRLLNGDGRVVATSDEYTTLESARAALEAVTSAWANIRPVRSSALGD